jgi:hypothetical protein
MLPHGDECYTWLRLRDSEKCIKNAKALRGCHIRIRKIQSGQIMLQRSERASVLRSLHIPDLYYFSSGSSSHVLCCGGLSGLLLPPAYRWKSVEHWWYANWKGKTEAPVSQVPQGPHGVPWDSAQAMIVRSGDWLPELWFGHKSVSYYKHITEPCLASLGMYLFSKVVFMSATACCHVP